MSRVNNNKKWNIEENVAEKKHKINVEAWMEKYGVMLNEKYEQH